MAFTEVTGGGSNIKSYWPKKAAERKVGDNVIGKYKTKMERSNPDGTKSVLYVIESADGLVGVNSSAMIARAMSEIPEGSTVKIVYNGKARSQKTGREFNNFSIYIDTDDGTDEKSDDTVDLTNLDF